MARISPDGSVPGPATEGDSSTTARLQELETKVENLLVALDSQRLIGVAMGLVAQQAGGTTEDAWQLLSRLSQDSNVKVRELARVIVEDFDGTGSGRDAELLGLVRDRLRASDGDGDVPA